MLWFRPERGLGLVKPWGSGYGDVLLLMMWPAGSQKARGPQAFGCDGAKGFAMT